MRSSAAKGVRPASCSPQSLAARTKVSGFRLAIRQATSAARPSCTRRPAKGNRNACCPSREWARSISSVFGSGSRLHCD